MAKKTAPFFSLEDFHQAAKAAGADKPLKDARIRHSFDTEVKASEEEGSRILNFVISTASVDRMGDTIALDGWDLENYRKNPVVLWAHDASLLPVAKSLKVWPESGKLRSEAEFTPPGMAKFNDTVFDMYRLGFLSATSVGFAPSRYAFADRADDSWGIDFMEQELLEYSCVPIPANAEALIEGKAAGIDIAPVLDFCEAALLRAADAQRVAKLAESILGGDGKDMAVLAWAEKIVAATGKCIISKERIAAIERVATKARLGKKLERSAMLLKLSEPR